MNTKQQFSHQLAWQPEPAKKPELVNPYEEGKILLNAPDEEIELPAMRPIYSEKQLRTIKRKNNNIKYKKKNHQRALMKDLLYEDVLYD